MGTYKAQYLCLNSKSVLLSFKVRVPSLNISVARSLIHVSVHSYMSVILIMLQTSKNRFDVGPTVDII